MRAAYRKAYFPAGVKLAQLEDVNHFDDNHAVNCTFDANSEPDLGLDPGTDTSDSDEADDTFNDDSSDSDEAEWDANDDIFDSSESVDSSEQKKQKNHNAEVDIVWAKDDRGVWGLAHVSGDKLYLTRDLVDDRVDPTDFAAPKSASKRARACGKPAAKQADDEHVQLFRTQYKKGTRFHSEPPTKVVPSHQTSP